MRNLADVKVPTLSFDENLVAYIAWFGLLCGILGLIILGGKIFFRIISGQSGSSVIREMGVWIIGILLITAASTIATLLINPVIK